MSSGTASRCYIFTSPARRCCNQTLPCTALASFVGSGRAFNDHRLRPRPTEPSSLTQNDHTCTLIDNDGRNGLLLLVQWVHSRLIFRRCIHTAEKAAPKLHSDRGIQTQLMYSGSKGPARSAKRAALECMIDTTMFQGITI